MNIARTTANILTLSRVLITPLILVSLTSDIHGGAGKTLLLMGVAMVTDYLDGAIARRYAVESRFGQIADAFTDALVFMAIFAGLAIRNILPFWLPVLFVGREITMYVVIRPTLSRLNIDVGARSAGKFKTVIQAGVSFAVLLTMLFAPDQARGIAVPLITFAALISIISLYWYIEPILSRRSQDGLRFSIVATCISLWLFQIFILAVTAELGVPGNWALYVLIHTGLASGLTLLLLRRRSDFVIDIRPRLQRINSANVLTLARLTSIPTVIFLITAATAHSMPAWPVLVILSAVLLTDLADGVIARRLDQVTRIGSYLDSTTDYLLLGAAAILSLAYELGTPWVFAALVGRLAVQAVAVAWIASTGRPIPSATPLGKVSIAAGMVLLAVELAATLGEPTHGSEEIVPSLITFLEIGLVGILAASAVEKIFLLITTIRRSCRPIS